MSERVIVNEKTGESIEIPDTIIAADAGEFYDAPHHRPKLAAAGVTERRFRRPLVERYIAASSAQREQLVKQADAQHEAFAKAAINEGATVATPEPTDLPPAA